MKYYSFKCDDGHSAGIYAISDEAAIRSIVHDEPSVSEIWYMYAPNKQVTIFADGEITCDAQLDS